MSYDEFVVDVQLGELGRLAWTLKAHFPERWFCLRDPKAPNGVIIDGSTDDKLRFSRGVSSMDALAFAVSVGDLGLLQRIHQDKDLCSDTNKSEAVSLAARLGRLEMMTWLAEQGIDAISDRVVYDAARSGRLEALQWVHSCERLQSFDPRVLLSAGVASGRQDVVEWICETFPTASLTLDRKSGEYLRDVEVASVLEWLCVKGRAQPEEWTIQVACRADSVPLLRLLMERIPQLKVDFSSLGNRWCEACARGHLEVVQYLYEEFDVYRDYAFEYAAGNGHKKVAEYLFGVNPVKCRAISKETVVRTIYDGHVDVLEWVYSVHKVDLVTVWHDAVVYYFKTVSLRDALAFPGTRTPKTDTGLRAVAQWALDRDEFWVHDLQIVAKWAAQRCQVDILLSVVATIIKHLEHHSLTRHAQLGKVLDAVVENTTPGDVVQTILQQDPLASR
ncbi:hypothetical protein Poli38472_000107 [Pythium oligandrum]|uniref:Ankyrin repeat protein n=1 Tax=Pythium oligandrum TaxID=41045 RepID=A0A8K1CC29_PYTOL|nr:hypothetical protein Poli38472_000107 [Pythium oligandrum]|eukprot:TMW60065.1 hypothetical protein Poli38472_000107 [Pythium oligandrum]